MKLLYVLFCVYWELDALHTRRLEPADSATIDGPDCGHVKQIIGKWQKAKRVGQLAGEARAAVMQAGRVQELADKSLGHAQTLKAEVGGGAATPGLTARVTEAKAKVSSASAAATKLETTLNTFKTKIPGEFSGQGVSAQDMVTLKKETATTIAASKEAEEAAAGVLVKVKQAHAAVILSGDEATTAIKNAINLVVPALKELKDVILESGWAVKDATRHLATVAAVKTKVDNRAAASKAQTQTDANKPVDERRADGQAGVFEALSANIQGQEDAVKGDVTALETAITDAGAVRDKLDGHIGPLKSAEKKGIAGDVKVASEASGLIANAQTSVDDSTASINVMQSKVKNLQSQTDKLKALLKDASAKVA